MPTFTLNGQPLPYGQFVTGEGEAAITHTAEVLTLWSDAELAAIGVVRIPDPTPEPAPPPRPELDKGVIESRLDAIGKLGDAFAALQANPLMFGQWFRQSWPNVYKDDPALLQMLQQIGLTPEQIATVTA